MADQAIGIAGDDEGIATLKKAFTRRHMGQDKVATGLDAWGDLAVQRLESDLA